ncbi:General stress protein A [Ceratobasidium theobromae]|uniref:General stress protein A n=1 Tax=Ceratobasidium theobromae TaxID=1582974 RepID=A0A5N5QJM8_9AGAM|nr:General stress protein A [Ceratobasidium theobromae]
MSEPNSSDSPYRFTETQDWFSGHIPLWCELFSKITSPAPRALEIGSWEGRSAVFTLTELCKSGSLVSIDHFDGFHTETGRERYNKLAHNLAATGRPHRIIPQFSVPGLMTLLQEATQEPDPGFDWIYVDGSHEASDTLLDGELSWRLARKGAIIVFDDYRWDREPPSSSHHPQRGIDSFMVLHAGEFEVLSGTMEEEYQMVLRKTVEMNIGFAFQDASPELVHRELGSGWGVNIALATDSEYAMPAAVAISSAAEATPGRITFYILDCGLKEQDIARIRESLPGRPDVTIVFLPLPAANLTHELGPVWSKFDLITVLPVERVLYLDADILVRKDLRPLWSTDMGLKMIAAAPDVGHPFGHPSLKTTDHVPYFNAGVLLIDLSRVRSITDTILPIAQKMKNAPFKDQDALNVIFQDKWHELCLKWNASGLGTYADIPTPERGMLRLEQMVDPCIVHFTGPLHPPMDHVINPWVQPYVAKPWGYAGAPGHPYAAEWWCALEKTAFRGLKGSQGYQEMKKVEADRAKEVGLKKFEAALAVDAAILQHSSE